MSSTNKWLVVIVIIIIIVLGLWWGGFLGSSAPAVDQSAQPAAVQAAAPIDSSDAIIATEAAAIDAQMKVLGNQYAALSQAPTAAKADLVAGQLGSVSSLMKTIADRFQARVTALKSIGNDTTSLQAAISDMTLQVSTAVSQIGFSAQALAKVNTNSGSAQDNQNSASVKQSVIQLQKAQIYLQAAQNDIKSVIAGFKATVR